MRTLTIGLWLVSLAVSGIAAIIALQIGVMATSVDPIELATNGFEPWTDALITTSCAVAVGIATAIALRLWHNVRFKAIGLLLTAIDIAAVAWLSTWFYREYL